MVPHSKSGNQYRSTTRMQDGSFPVVSMNDRPEPAASAFEEGARPRKKRTEHCPWCDAAPGEPCVSLMGRKLGHFTHYVK